MDRKRKVDPSLIKNLNITSLDITDSGYVLVGSKRHALLQRWKSEKIFFSSLDDVQINSINYVSENEIWYATFGSGVLLQDIGTFKNFYSKDGFDPKGMVFSIFGVEPKKIYSHQKWTFCLWKK